MEASLIIPALIAGLLTFLAPCTLPLVPAYLGFISGVSVDELRNRKSAKNIRRKVFLNGLLYVIGFSLVFILLGSAFGSFGAQLAHYRILLGRIGGILVIIFGLYMMHAIRIPILNREYRFNLNQKLKPGNPLSSFLFGATFAFGWTPCVGPGLGTILTLALQTGTAAESSFLLFVFSIGLGLPFLLIALLFSSAITYIKKISKYLHVISFVGGLFLVFLGILLMTNNLVVWNAHIYELFDFIGYDKLLEYL